MASSWNDDDIRASICEDDLEENYYSVLNIPSNANDKEITHAYHKYGLIYHPDKHKEPVDKRNAELLFSKIKKAYDILINPHKRAIYDSVGTKGLEEDGLQVVIRSKTPREIREEYERLAKEKEEKLLEKLTFSEGHFSIQTDATNLFDEDRFYRDPNKPYVNMKNYSMEQSIDFPLTSKDTLTLAGSLDTEDKLGSGSVSATMRRVLSSNSYVSVKGTMGAKRGFELFGFKRLTQRLKASSNTIFHYKNGSLAPVFNNVLNYQFTDNLQGQIKYRTMIGFVKSSMTSMLIYQKDAYYMDLTLNLSLKNLFLSYNLSRSFLNDTLKLKGMIRHGYTGTIISYAIEKQVTKFSRVDACIMVNSVAGVFLNLQVNRGRQTFMFPIHLSSEIMPSAIFYGTVTPVIVYYVVKRLIIDPYVKEKEENEANRKQEKLKSELLEKRRLAMAAQNLMTESVHRILEREGPNGLVITKAIYGKIIDKDEESEKIIDVILPLQLLVKDHNLQILSDQSKCDLEGFYDPCIGETKKLYIEYIFRKEKYQVTCSDNENLRIPRSSHKVQWWSKPFNSVK